MRLSLLPAVTTLLLASGGPPPMKVCACPDARPFQPPTRPGSDGLRLQSRLRSIVDGLLWTSESDFPFEVFVIPGRGRPPPTRDDVKYRIAPVYRQRPDTMPLADRAVEVTTVDDVLQPRLWPRSDWGAEDRRVGRRLEDLREVLVEELHGAQVFRIGPGDPYQGLSPDIDVFFVGASDDGDLVGVATVSIET